MNLENSPFLPLFLPPFFHHSLRTYSIQETLSSKAFRKF